LKGKLSLFLNWYKADIYPGIKTPMMESRRALAAEFRADYSRQVNDQAINALIEALTRKSPAFRRCWQEQAVLRREGGERRFNDPQDGPCRFLQSTLVLASDAGIKLVTLEPVQ
jgi:hypothetical protein